MLKIYHIQICKSELHQHIYNELQIETVQFKLYMIAMLKLSVGHLTAFQRMKVVS